MAEGFGAAADVVNHPGGEGEVIGVAGDFTAVAAEGGDEFGEEVGRAFDEEVGFLVGVPVFGLDAPGRGGPAGGFPDGGVDEEVGAEVGGVGVAGVGIKDPAGVPAAEDFGEGVDAGGPGVGVVVGGSGVDALPVEDFEFPAEAGAGVGEFAAAGVTAGGVAAEGDGDVDDAGAGFALEAEGERAGENLVVGMRGKEEGNGRAGRGRGKRGGGRGLRGGQVGAEGLFVAAKKFPIGVHVLTKWRNDGRSTVGREWESGRGGEKCKVKGEKGREPPNEAQGRTR